MMVSPDGLLKCVENCGNGQCENAVEVPIGPLALEIKSRYSPTANKELMPLNYTPPVYNLCQLMAEMKILDTNTLWFVSSSPQSVALSILDFDDKIWSILWKAAKDIYDGNDITEPKTLPGNVSEIKCKMEKFIDKNAIIAAEVPLLKCRDNEMYSNMANVRNPAYRFRKNYPLSNIRETNIQRINTRILECCTRSVKLIREAYDMCRRKATEVLLFVLTDTDRDFNKDKPAAVPLAYALKGKSIRLDTARKMVNDVRNYLHEQKCSVLVEAYDGQWAGLVFRDAQNKPLTIFELQRECWSDVNKASKERLLKFFETMSEVSNSEMDDWSKRDFLNKGIFRFGNIRIELGIHSHDKDDTTFSESNNGIDENKPVPTFLAIETFCQRWNVEGGLTTIKVPMVHERPDLWETEMSCGNLFQILGLRPPPKNIGLDNVIPPDTIQLQDDVRDLANELLDSSISDEDDHGITASEFSTIIIPETDMADQIRRVLFTTHKFLLEHMLFSLLCQKRFQKWSEYDIDTFYDEILSSTMNIYNNLTVYEVDSLLKIIKENGCSDCPLVLIAGQNKLRKCNILGFILGHRNRVFGKKPKPRMMSLRNLCRNEIHRTIPVNVLRVTIAQWLFKIQLPRWMDHSPVPVTYKIPVYPHEIDIFSYPEYNTNRKQIESRIIDPSHCLTNLRLHATQRGFFGCSKNAFLRVSKCDNNLLNRALLEEPIPDKQSVPFAERIFSKPVEGLMRKNNDIREADMVMHIRQWYEACNRRGLSVTKRLTSLVQMNNYMLQFYKAEHFPMKTTHVGGLPSTTFQAILQNISTRIQLYHISEKKTYNHRAVSTLAVESMFSNLTTLSRPTSGIPLAAKIPRYISMMTQMTTTMANPNK